MTKTMTNGWRMAVTMVLAGELLCAPCNTYVSVLNINLDAY